MAGEPLERPSKRSRLSVQAGVGKQAERHAGGGQAVAHRGQIARAAALERKPGQGPLHVRRAPQQFSQIAALVARVDEIGDKIQAPANCLRVAQGCGQMCRQQARASAR